MRTSHDLQTNDDSARLLEQPDKLVKRPTLGLFGKAKPVVKPD